MRNSLRIGTISVALFASAGLTAAQNIPDSGQINRGAGEVSRPPTGAPAGVMQQSGSGEKVGDVPATNTPSGAFPERGSAAAPGATHDTSATMHQPTSDAGATTGAAPSGPIGATEQTMPSKFSEKNAALDKTPIMAYPFNLTDEQKRTIYDSLAANTEIETRAIDTEPANALPADVRTHDLPEKLTEQMPQLKGYKFVKLHDKIVLVSAPNNIVVGEITR